MNEIRQSVVARRLRDFLGRSIALRLTWCPDADVIGELLAAVPLGREAFLEMRIEGRVRMINLRAVLALEEVE